MHTPPSDPRFTPGHAPTRARTSVQGGRVVIVTAAGHALAWLTGKPGAPRTQRVLVCERCGERLYLSDFSIAVRAEYERAVAELRALIEQHGGDACP